MLILGTAKENW